jgi:hypothetical protein
LVGGVGDAITVDGSGVPGFVETDPPPVVAVDADASGESG